jgi:spore germination cell wall hydrolase CwlJ-like protein
MPWDTYNIGLLALTAWRESRGEPLEGIRAVMHVVRNRVESWKTPWSKVLCGKNQFSSLTVPGDSQLVRWPIAGLDTKFEAILALAESIYKGTDEDNTLGATYYYNPTTATSGWFKKNVVDSPKFRKTTTIGNHEFYGEVK